MKNTITNPILKGFNPDPSIIRVGDDYYIATSTFEWFPGVQIHHSKDLVNWRLLTRPLNRTSQINMLGNADSGGVWAPCLSYDNGTFYLVYSDAKNVNWRFKDNHNYMVTTKNISGEWSDPVYLNSSGFDASLFHDDDGRKWVVNLMWDHRPGKYLFGGIVLQEYSTTERKLIGPSIKIFEGTKLGCTEGPHIFKHNGYYYLMTAEGGTGWDHAVTLARSKSLTGPYEVDPKNPLLTAKHHHDVDLKRTGHADLVETQLGEWYMVHLCGRPLANRGRCNMGRETAIQKVKWTDEGWLELESGTNKPETLVPAPDLPLIEWNALPARDDFDSPNLRIDYQTLRIPLNDESLSLTERKGFLRLKGRESLTSVFNQSLVARRQQAACYTATTGLDFDPQNFQQMAGLVCYYNTKLFIYLYVSYDDEFGKHLNVMLAENEDNPSFALEQPIQLPAKGGIHLKVEVQFDQLYFSFSVNEGTTWKPFPKPFDASLLSDEFGGSHKSFTGSFVGMCCQDLEGTRIPADFDYFEYIENE